MAFKQLFVKNYGGEDENEYSVAVFTQQDFYDSVSYVMEQVVPAHTHTHLRLFGLWSGGLQVWLADIVVGLFTKVLPYNTQGLHKKLTTGVIR